LYAEIELIVDLCFVQLEANFVTYFLFKLKSKATIEKKIPISTPNSIKKQNIFSIYD